MNRIRIYICIALTGLAVVKGAAQANRRIMEGLSMPSKILDCDVRYAVILPEDYYTSNASYPVVYLLHGFGDNESSWLEYGRVSQAVDEAVRQGEIISMIYVMPQGFTSYYVNDHAGKFPYQDMFIKELVPFIDATYRTITGNKHRATLGYSMGGYGALMLPVKNPDVFTVSVPLSISVRTDAQYSTEEAPGWDEQWGRLFGGMGTRGEARLTEYYKQNSPFHLFTQKDLGKYKSLKIYMDNGDDEETLCRSNEELHILLRDKNFPHEFRVRNGGHEFAYWRSALPNGLRFISDVFEGKPYRGDQKKLTTAAIDSSLASLHKVKPGGYTIWLPEEYNLSDRLYPAIYCLGSISDDAKNNLVNQVRAGIKNATLPPVLVVFVNDNSVSPTGTIIHEVEKNYRARSGWRFRALIAYGKEGGVAMDYVLTPDQVTACALFDVPVPDETLKPALPGNGKQGLSRTWLYIAVPDKSANYHSNSRMHILLRDEKIYHEYRVQEGAGGEAWFTGNLAEALDFIQRKIHR